jgi:hypothetical protein
MDPNLQGKPAAALPAYLCTGGGGVPLGYQQISAATLASATNLTVPTGAVLAIIRCETANVRWRDDGTAPTASVGMPMTPTDEPFRYTANLAAIRHCRDRKSLAEYFLLLRNPNALPAGGNVSVESEFDMTNPKGFWTLCAVIAIAAVIVVMFGVPQ